MKIIKLTRNKDGNTLFVNIDKIAYFYEVKGLPMTCIHLVSGEKIYVSENVTDIQNLIYNI